MKKQKQDGEGQDVPADHAKTKPKRTDQLLKKTLHQAFAQAFRAIKDHAEK